MSSNEFFLKQGPISLKKITNDINCQIDSASFEEFNIHGLESLDRANDKDMTFLSSSKYKEIAIKTKAAACITSMNLSQYLPKKCIKLNVKNILLAVTQVSKMFYPNADFDYPDKNLIEAKNLKANYPKIYFGKNVFVGKNVKIGENSSIGSNSVIESNVTIGKNCLIGALVTIRNSIISNSVHIQDGCVIGTKGFGFIPMSKKNLRTPHIGKTILKDGVEVGANSTIDRGSLTDTVIGENTFMDNQVHVAHNVKIGKNCMIAGQAGIAGSTTIGDNVIIGGGTGISGHLTIGNNVKIGGGSGVIDDILENSQVMGYPAVNLRDFVKNRKKK